MFNEAAPLWRNGPAPGKYFHFPGQSTTTGDDAKKHTMAPVTTGSSVIALKFDGGVILAADNLGSYGGLARYRNIERIFKVTDSAVVGCAGDIADFQFLQEIIEQKVRDDVIGGYSKSLDAGAMYTWLGRVLYNRRSRFDPLWLGCVVAGFRGDQVILGHIDKIGTTYEADEICNGFGQHMVIPLFRDLREKKGGVLNKEDALKAVEEGMKTLYYRDCRAFHKYSIAIITKDGVEMRKDQNLRMTANWEVFHSDKNSNIL